MGVLDSIRMEGTTTTIMVEMGTSTIREMSTTIMATGITTIITPPGQMAITMVTTMAETTMSPRRGILVRWNAISATRLGILYLLIGGTVEASTLTLTRELKPFVGSPNDLSLTV
jgi:hypothetical protein